AQPGSARGIILYIGLSEEEAAASGTNLTEIAESLRDYTQELAPSSETQAIIALAPSGPERDLDAVRAVATGSPAARGAAARSHGPVRSR
ncbi:transcriptional regulator, partial [Brevibacterium paucivorans]